MDFPTNTSIFFFPTSLKKFNASKNSWTSTRMLLRITTTLNIRIVVYSRQKNWTDSLWIKCLVSPKLYNVLEWTSEVDHFTRYLIRLHLPYKGTYSAASKVWTKTHKYSRASSKHRFWLVAGFNGQQADIFPQEATRNQGT